MTDLLQEALFAKESGDIALAKQLVSQALVQNPRNEAAWLLMSDVVEDVKLRRTCLERVLTINPNNTDASSALNKLNTSPLSPISRGERDKPIDLTTVEKVPPFTPPFTWEGEQEQYLALGDVTYPNVPGETPTSPPEAAPTFDWTNESKEPDKTIQKIFDAVSKPELASQSLPDTDFNWLDEQSSDVNVEQTGETPFQAGEQGEDEYLEELVGPAEEFLPEGQPLSMDNFRVSAEPQLGLEAFTIPVETLESVTPDYRMWDNPKARNDRMVILSNKSVMFAQPKEADIPQIHELFAENKMLRDLLSEKSKTILLEDIWRVTANPNRSSLSIDYKDKGKKRAHHQLTFSSREVRDEVLDALQLRLGADFGKTTHLFSLSDKIIPPVVTLLIIAFIAWLLISGLPIFSSLPPSQLGSLQGFIFGFQDIIDSIGTFNIFLVALAAGLITLIWLINNLRQPTRLSILQRLQL